MTLFIGTSGFGYPAWKAKFYPRSLPPQEMLTHYATHFNAVEINNTFYKMPAASVLAGWAAQVPSEFVFAFKSPQQITHFRRLVGADERVNDLIKAIDHSSLRSGPVLFGLPPNFKKDLSRLKAFLGILPTEKRFAFEFRHQSWFDDETLALLREHGIALCIVDDENDLQIPFESTADWAYFRLRRLDYKAADLRRWASRIRKLKSNDAFIFFKHEERALGPKFAEQFKQFFQT